MLCLHIAHHHNEASISVPRSLFCIAFCYDDESQSVVRMQVGVDAGGVTQEMFDALFSHMENHLFAAMNGGKLLPKQDMTEQDASACGLIFAAAICQG